MSAMEESEENGERERIVISFDDDQVDEPETEVLPSEEADQPADEQDVDEAEESEANESEPGESSETDEGIDDPDTETTADGSGDSRSRRSLRPGKRVQIGLAAALAVGSLFLVAALTVLVVSTSTSLLPEGRTGLTGKIGQQGPEGHKGWPGNRGPKGKDGADGKDGRDGEDGRSTEVCSTGRRDDEYWEWVDDC